MGHELQALSARHKVMVGLVLRGWPNKKIAESLGMHEQSISYIVNSGAFQKEVSRRRESIESLEDEEIGQTLGIARVALEREALPSVMKLAEIRDQAPDQSLQRQAANDILRAAFARENNAPAGGQLGQVIVMNAEQINFLNQVVKESGLDNPCASGNGHNGETTLTDGARELPQTG